MKRRNAETGKMRRPVKRTKITEGMYGNSMLYLKFVMIWATVVMADYMLEFRFEFLWPFWIMLRSVYDSFKYQGLAFSVFFICIALTSDMICFFFIPLQYIFFAASTYVWVQYVWYTFADKGICVPTVAICCLLVYVEGLWRGSRGGSELCRPLAAHCVGYPVVTLGFGAKALISHRLRERRQRHVRAMNEFYFQLMRDALPESALEQNQQQQQCAGQSKESAQVPNGGTECASQAAGTAHAHANGSVRRRVKTDQNGHTGYVQDPVQLQAKLEKLEKHLATQSASREREKCSAASSSETSTSASSNASTHAHSNAPDHCKGSAKPSKLEKKEASTLKEEKRKNKNKDKDKENDSHKSTEHTKEQIVKDKEVESTKDCVKIKECNGNRDKEREREREREKEREKETREREKEREREREREQRSAELRSECAAELRRVRAELSAARAELGAARAAEAEAGRALAAAAAAERARRADHALLKQAHAALQHKVSTWRSGERAALERRLGEERRARTAAETLLLRAKHHARTPSGECENETCRSRRTSCETENATLRRDLQRARDRAMQLQRDLTLATEQVRSLEARVEQQQHQQQQQAAGEAPRGWQALHERAAHLERSLSAETRVKLDLLSALGDAKRKMCIQESLISRQEKEIEELKAQMLAVMPTEYVTGVPGVSKLRLSDASPLDPNATVYTPKQLCSDA